MKILVVEDDQLKLKDIQRFVEKVCEGVHVDSAESYATAVSMCYSVMYDFVVLDMNIPRYDRTDNDKSIIDNGGEMIVRELVSEDIYIKFVFLSGYETVGDESIESFDKRMKQYCPDTYRGFVFFEVNDDSWKQKLGKILQEELYAEHIDR